MSKCISSDGEYSDHELAEQPRFTCARCFVFDEDAALAALDEAERELVRLRAQVASIGVIAPGAVALPNVRPDDRDADEAIAEADCFVDALWEISEKYETPLTNNLPRWQDGRFLRHVSDFIGDVKGAVGRWVEAPLIARAEAAEAAIERVRTYIESDPSISLEPMSPGAIILATLAPVTEEGDKE